MTRDETAWTWWTLPPAISGRLAQRYRGVALGLVLLTGLARTQHCGTAVPMRCVFVPRALQNRLTLAVPTARAACASIMILLALRQRRHSVTTCEHPMLGSVPTEASLPTGTYPLFSWPLAVKPQAAGLRRASLRSLRVSRNSVNGSLSGGSPWAMARPRSSSALNSAPMSTAMHHNADEARCDQSRRHHPALSIRQPQVAHHWPPRPGARPTRVTASRPTVLFLKPLRASGSASRGSPPLATARQRGH